MKDLKNPRCQCKNKIKIILVVSIFFGLLTPALSFACVRGDATAYKGRSGHKLQICVTGDGFEDVNAYMLLEFFKHFESDGEFKRRVESTIGESFEGILKYLEEKPGSIIQLYSDDSAGLQYLAERYRSFKGVSEEVARRKSESKPIPFSVSQLPAMTKQNKDLIQRIKSASSCYQAKGNVHVIRVDFRDGDTITLLPVDIKPSPTRKGQYELSFIPSPRLSSFLHDSSVHKRVLILSTARDSQWVNKGESFPIASRTGFKRFGASGVDAIGISNSCDLKKIVTKVTY